MINLSQRKLLFLSQTLDDTGNYKASDYIIKCSLKLAQNRNGSPIEEALMRQLGDQRLVPMWQNIVGDIDVQAAVDKIDGYLKKVMSGGQQYGVGTYSLDDQPKSPYVSGHYFNEKEEKYSPVGAHDFRNRLGDIFDLPILTRTNELAIFLRNLINRYSRTRETREGSIEEIFTPPGEGENENADADIQDLVDRLGRFLSSSGLGSSGAPAAGQATP